MRHNPIHHRVLLVCGILAFAGRPALADEGKSDKAKAIPAGTWEKKDSEPHLTFSGEDTLTIHPHGDHAKIEIECSYTITRDGLVKAKITRIGGADEIVEKVKNVAPVGLEFQFKWKVAGDKATIDDVDGKDVDVVKERLEGDYSKKP